MPEKKKTFIKTNIIFLPVVVESLGPTQLHKHMKYSVEQRYSKHKELC